MAFVVVQTVAKSWTGPYLYSDRVYHPRSPSNMVLGHAGLEPPVQPALNRWAQVPVLGMGAGIMRMVLAIVHVTGHLLAAFLTLHPLRHSVHIAKGLCEFVRGAIETLPLLGNLFARWYDKNGYVWGIKIFWPLHQDTLDTVASSWGHLKNSWRFIRVDPIRLSPNQPERV